MKSKRISTAWPLPVALLLLAEAAGAATLAPVETVSARRAPLVEELNLTGTLTAPHVSRVAPAVAGRIMRITVDAGDRVESGDELLSLDAELAEFELEQARASEREAASQLADARRRLTEAQRLARTQSFAATEVRSREAEVARASAVVERLRAVRAYDEALLARHTLEAPFGGVIARRDADLGEWVTPDTPVLELVEVDRLRLDLQVPQAYFGRIVTGTALTIDIDALPGAQLDTAVSSVVPVSDATTRTFLARAELDNAHGRIAPGMSVRATLRIGTGREGIVVPRDAIIRYPDGRKVVWVVNGEGDTRRVEERRVVTGLATARYVQIRDGLEAGVSVVVRGNESLRQDQEVRVSASR